MPHTACAEMFRSRRLTFLTLHNRQKWLSFTFAGGRATYRGSIFVFFFRGGSMTGAFTDVVSRHCR